MKAVNQAAVCNILKLYPKAKTKGFASAVRNYLFKLFDPKDDPDADWAEGLSDRERRAKLMEMYGETFPPAIRPDLYEIDEEKRLIRLFEIEDTNPLSDAKLAIIFNWWWELDCEDLELELYVSDRYGLNLRKLDLAAFCLHQEFDLPPNAPGTHAIAAEIGVRFDQTPIPPPAG
jgi:hypothetical protein